MKTKDRLARDLKLFNAPEKMIEYAKNGFYDDYESPIATPIIRLVQDCLENGINEIAERAKNGEYDATKEESDTWFNTEGKRYLDDNTWHALKG